MVAAGCSKKKDIADVPGMNMGGEDRDMVMQTITSVDSMEPSDQLPAQPSAGMPESMRIEVNAPETGQKIAMAADPVQRNKQIQVALKNANLYFGDIDGKAGPLTRKAIEEFQKMKGLTVDGKVGPVTWGELQKYLTVKPEASAQSGPGLKNNVD